MYFGKFIHLDVMVSTARFLSLVGSKHHPGEKKIVNTNYCFPLFFGLILALSRSLRKCPRGSEENSAVEKEFKIPTLKLFLLTDVRPTCTLVPMLTMCESTQATFEIFVSKGSMLQYHSSTRKQYLNGANSIKFSFINVYYVLN